MPTSDKIINRLSQTLTSRFGTESEAGIFRVAITNISARLQHVSQSKKRTCRVIFVISVASSNSPVDSPLGAIPCYDHHSAPVYRPVAVTQAVVVPTKSEVNVPAKPVDLRSMCQ